MMIKSSTDNLKYYQTYIIDVISLNIYAVFKVLTEVKEPSKLNSRQFSLERR